MKEKMLTNAANIIAVAADNSPIKGIVVVALFYFGFSLFEMAVEEVLFGKRSPHAGDIVFVSFFLYMSWLVVVQCAANKLTSG